jgi:hypothetical protein
MPVRERYVTRGYVCDWANVARAVRNPLPGARPW